MFNDNPHKQDKGSFIGKGMRYSQDKSLDEVKQRHASGYKVTQWANRRPICPYGCGQEGTLIEVVVQNKKALGIYTHSESYKPFTADLEMAPKPTGQKIVIGADGEAHMVESI